jgi:RNA polymerase sigma-70 factor, ECF subfamily
MSEWSPDLTLLQAFDDDEWLRVERHYAGRLYAYVARRVLDAQAREDVVQESFLGSVRGIASFDSVFTFEQYLFGICRNRTIDHLRRRKATTLSSSDEDDDRSPIDQLAQEDETPSGIVRADDLRGHGRTLLKEVLRTWVQETWEAGEFRRLMVIEALFSGGWRNRDTWQRFELRDETAVAGIKFRALKRLRELAAQNDPTGSLVPALAQQAGEGEAHIDVSSVWRQARVSCPARHWLARHQAGSLESGPASFIQFHLGEMECPWCVANRDDLERSEDALEPLLERVRASTARYLRSKTL